MSIIFKSIAFPRSGGLDLEWEVVRETTDEEGEPEVTRIPKTEKNPFLISQEFGEELQLLGKLVAGYMGWTTREEKDRVTVMGLKGMKMEDHENPMLVVTFTKENTDGRSVGMASGLIPLETTRFGQKKDLRECVDKIVAFSIAHKWQGVVANPDLWGRVNGKKGQTPKLYSTEAMEDGSKRKSKSVKEGLLDKMPDDPEQKKADIKVA